MKGQSCAIYFFIPQFLMGVSIWAMSYIQTRRRSEEGVSVAKTFIRESCATRAHDADYDSLCGVYIMTTTLSRIGEVYLRTGGCQVWVCWFVSRISYVKSGAEREFRVRDRYLESRLEVISKLRLIKERSNTEQCNLYELMDICLPCQRITTPACTTESTTITYYIGHTLRESEIIPGLCTYQVLFRGNRFTNVYRVSSVYGHCSLSKGVIRCRRVRRERMTLYKVSHKSSQLLIGLYAVSVV